MDFNKLYSLPEDKKDKLINMTIGFLESAHQNDRMVNPKILLDLYQEIINKN